MQQQRLAKAGAGFQRVNLRIDVSVGNKQIEPRAIVHVEESRAPAYVWIAGLAHSGGPTDIIESLRAYVAIERIGLLFEVRDEKTEAAAVVVIAPVDPHIAELHAFPAERDTREQAHIGECPIVVVVVEVAGHRVVSNKEIGPPVIVIVDPHYSETIIADVIMHSRLDGNFLESAVATIVIEEIAFTLQAPGTALHQNAFETAEFVAAELGQVVHIQMGIAGNEEIDKTIAVVITPCRPGHKAAAADSGLFGNVLEFAVAETMVKRTASISGNE